MIDVNSQWPAMEGVFIMPSGLQPALRSIVALLAQGRTGRSPSTDGLDWYWLAAQDPIAPPCAREDRQPLWETADTPTFDAHVGNAFW